MESIPVDWSRHRVEAPVEGVRAFQLTRPLVTSAYFELDPAVSVPEHVHEGDEIGVVLEGAIEITAAGESRVVGEGEVFVIPKGTRHAARTADRACRLFECYAPHR